MYSALPNFVLGFHGCDKTVRDRIINNEDVLKASSNSYDWLGNGIYFWESNPIRALEYARILKDNPKRSNQPIIEEAVIGAIIDLGYCLNLMESNSLEIVRQGYKTLSEACESAKVSLPKNRTISGSKDILLRHLDCAVIESVHEFNRQQGKKPYESVRGLFIEGEELYPNAGFRESNHIQICVRNPNCIKGYFVPLEADFSYPIP